MSERFRLVMAARLAFEIGVLAQRQLGMVDFAFDLRSSLKGELICEYVTLDLTADDRFGGYDIANNHGSYGGVDDRRLYTTIDKAADLDGLSGIDHSPNSYTRPDCKHRKIHSTVFVVAFNDLLVSMHEPGSARRCLLEP